MRKSTKRQKKAVRTPTRLSPSPLSQLRRFLDVFELTAADDVINGYRLSNGLPVIRDDCLGIPFDDINADAADEKAAQQFDLLEIYDQWRADLHGTRELEIVTAVLIHETPLSEIDSMAGQRRGSAREFLGRALYHLAYLKSPKRLKDMKFNR